MMWFKIFKINVDRVVSLSLSLAWGAASGAAISAAPGQAQGAEVEANVLASSRLLQRSSPQPSPKQSSTARKRPKPVRLPSGWFVTERGAGSRLSCVNYKPMEVVDSSAALETETETLETSKQSGFLLRVPYSAVELKNLEFILQTENYEELHRMPLPLKSTSETRRVELPIELMQQHTDSAYRWFVEATIICQSEVDEPLDSAIAPDPESLDTRTSSIGGWIERNIDSQSPQI